MKKTAFSDLENQRYHRHFILPELGIMGQQKLSQAKVLVIGAGGLSCPLLQYLAAAGVGYIGIMDADIVAISNLHRQILYSESEVGALKVQAAKQALLRINPHIHIECYPYLCTSENALEIFAQYDVIADGSDNFATRYLVNDACVLTGKPLVYGAINRFEGQLAVFNLRNENGFFSSNYRDIFPLPPLPGEVLDCAEAGVLGVLPGIIGSMQALEVIKILTQIGKPLIDTLFYINTLTFETHHLLIEKDEANPLTGKTPTQTGLIDYALFCNAPSTSIQEISPAMLRQWQTEGRVFQLIDVREAAEYAQENIGGLSLPLSTLRAHVSQIRQDIPVVVHCQSGKRSKTAIEILKNELNFRDLYNLTGGLTEFYK